MFKVNVSNTFKYPVKFSVIDENGRQQNHEIKLLFKRLPAEEQRALLAEIKQDGQARAANEDDGIFIEPRDQIEAEADFILRVAEGWEGVDINGDTDFNRDNLITLINAVPNLIGEIWGAFFTATSGGQKRKN